MEIIDPQKKMDPLSPARIQEKADILETNLFKSISRQTDLSRMQIRIDRTKFPDAVIQKALLHLMPRFNVKPQDFLLGLRDILQKAVSNNKKEIFEKELSPAEENQYDDLSVATRKFEAVASLNEIEIIISGIPEIKTIHGEIAKSFFNHEESPGRLLKDGVINFREINKYPIVNAGDNLFYITHEKQGRPGLSFDGKIIPVEAAKPYILQIGPAIKEISDPDESGKMRGYFLQAQDSGVVVIGRDEHRMIRSIDISETINIKKLDYSVGNIGTQYTCPIQMKVEEICSGFKIRVNGKVEATFLNGGEIITNNEAWIKIAQSGSRIMALKDIHIDSASQSSIISEQGTVTIARELMDSSVSALKIVFEKSKGLITHNQMEAEHLSLNGLYFSGENIIYFGNTLFAEKKETVKSREHKRADKLKYINTEKLLMGKLQLELKRMTQLAVTDQDLVKHIKPLIMATKTMNYEIIHREMDLIEKRIRTQVVSNVRKIFETLEKTPQSLQACEMMISDADESLYQLDRRMAAMKLAIEGYLRRAATLKIFCGLRDENKTVEPDIIIESDDNENKPFKIIGTYSSQKGFEFIR